MNGMKFLDLTVRCLRFQAVSERLGQGCDSVVEHLPSILESNPNTSKKKKSQPEGRGHIQPLASPMVVCDVALLVGSHHAKWTFVKKARK
jgi:hypothetical protein